MATVYVSPTGSGLRDGSSIENAGTIGNLNAHIAAAGPGGQVLLLADQGVYQQNTQVSISSGGTETAPVTIRGIDSNGNPMAAEIAGSRTVGWTPGASDGAELFRLLSGANNLIFEDLTIRNVGNGAFRVGADIANLTIRDVDAFNVTRFIEDYVSGIATSASIDGLTVQNVTVTGYSRNAIRLQYDTRNVLIENVVGDSQGQNGGLYISGVGIAGTAHDILLSHVEMKNSYGNGSSSQYWNGDGFSTELGVYNVRFENTIASGNTDAGYDLKSSNTVLDHAVADGNARNFRFWSQSITMVDSLSTNPHYFGGIATALHVWLGANAAATIDNLTFSDANQPMTLFDLLQGGAVLTLQNTPIPTGYENLVLTWNGSVVLSNSAPTAIALSGGSVEENAGAGTLVGSLSAIDPDAGDTHSFAIVGGAASLFEISGNDIHVKAGAILDFESQSTYGLAIQVTDQAGLTFDAAVAINLLDVTETGTAGNDLLAGGAGGDRLSGGYGNDTYLVNNSGDVVVEWSSQGTDLVQASIAKYSLTANVENLTYTGISDFVGTGNTLHNALTGGAGNDTLYGGGGNDVIYSGGGHDRVYGEAGRDQIHAGDGADTIYGGSQNDKIWGDGGDDFLSGGNDGDYLHGGVGNDVIDGGTGYDSMHGGVGNDTFIVDSVGDVVGELAGEGTDTVQSSIGYTLGTQVENLVLLGSGAISGTGNSLANTITGNGAANALSGGAGNDTLNGGAGNDRLVGGEGADIYQFNRGGGVDTVANFDTGGGADKLVFGASVSAGDLWFAQAGGNLCVSVLGSTDGIVLEGWYSDSRNQLDRFQLGDGSYLQAAQVQSLVTAMASFAVPPADVSSLPDAQQQTIESSIAAAWQSAA